jgi:hypothetical protein
VRRGRDLGAIRADRLTTGLEQAAGGRDRRIAAVAGYEEFRRRIFRILRRLACAPRVFAKVQAFRAKLLAMQRASL